MRKGWITLAVAIPLALAVLAVGGTWVYINLVKEDAPERLSLDTDTSTTTGTADATSTTAAAAGSSGTGVDGTWKVTAGSQAGYRVKEVLFGQSTEAVGRTSDVTGEIVIDGTTITSGTFTVDMTSIASDESRRDGRYRSSMNVSAYPTSTFELTEPITVPSLPAEGTEVNVEATGDLTLRGTTKPVTIDLAAERNGTTIKIAGSFPIVFEEWGIPNPSYGPATTEDNGEMELLLVLSR